MKKVLFLFLTFILLFSSCEKNKSPDFHLSLPLSLTVSTGGSKNSFKVEITEEACKAFFEEGHPLAETKIEIFKDKTVVTSGDYTRNTEKGVFPAQEALFKAIKTICNNKNSGVYTQDGIRYAIDEMTIMVYYDNDTKKITAIGTEENGEKFDFQIIAVNLYEAQSNGVG